jgi:hypothetical protein
MRKVVRREGSGGGVCERGNGEDAGGGERVRWGIGAWVGGGPLGGVNMRERDSGGDAFDENGGGRERMGRCIGVWVGGGPLGGVYSGEDSDGEVFDEDGGGGETARVVLAGTLVVGTLVVGAGRLAAELRVPTFRGGRGGKPFSTVELGVEVRGSS